MNKEFTIECDASDEGLGAVLSQLIEGRKQIIYFAGRQLINAERNYTILEKELLAVVFRVKKFRHYLTAKFNIITDHEPLK